MAGPGCSKRCATATWAAGTAAAATCPRATARSTAAPADRPPIRSTHGRPAMTQWYYSAYERNRHGPVGAADLAALHADGQLDPATLVWGEARSEGRRVGQEGVRMCRTRCAPMCQNNKSKSQ